MRHVAFKATVAALLSVVVSLLIALTMVPALGGTVDGTAWLMCIMCPLVIAWPASAYTFWQNARLKSAHHELARAHAQLSAAHRRLAEKASRDDMTGLLNRESFFAAVERRLDLPAGGALLIIDADNFKSINDRFGHLTGDDALLSITAAIGRGVRVEDLLGRIGGEEFGAFLAGATEDEAKSVAERIRHEVEMLFFQPMGEGRISLTVSIGGTLCGHAATLSQLMRRADRRLYEAKHGGRNLAIIEQNLPQAA